MAIVNYWYGLAKKHLGQGEIDWINGTVMLMLTTDTYVPYQDTDEYKDDVIGEVSATGYTPGGAEITNRSLTYTAATNTLSYDGYNVIFTITGSLTFRYAVIYLDTGTESTSPLIGYIDFGEDITHTDGSLTLNFDADGIYKDVIA